MTLLDLLRLMRKHLAVVITLPIACAAAMAAVSFLLMSNTYTADTTLYVQGQEASQNPNGSSLYSDFSAAQMIANDVASLADSETVLNAAANDLGLPNLDNFSISVASETNTRVIRLSVTGKDPEESARVANSVGSAISKVAQDSMGVKGVNVIDAAKTPVSPSGPNRLLYTAVALLGGLFLAIAGIVFVDMVNTKIRGVEDAEETLGIPVIGRIPLTKTER